MTISLHKEFCRRDRYAARAATLRIITDAVDPAESMDRLPTIIRRSEARRGYALCRSHDRIRRLVNSGKSTVLFGEAGDDSDLEQLKVQLAALLEKRQMLKDYNRMARESGRPTVSGPDLSLLSRLIRQLEKRIAVGGARAAAQARLAGNTIKGAGYTVSEDVEDNRLCFVFDAVPVRDVQDLLRTHGFKRSPSRGCWVRTLNADARYAARRAAAAIDDLLTAAAE